MTEKPAAPVSLGKRKSAVARVWLQPGNGEITVNEHPLAEYFPRETWQLAVRRPLEATNTASRYTVWATVFGGGLTGQAEALRHGIARALLSVNPELRERLRKEGLLTRDPRVKERKKYGQKGARKRFQYSKR